MKTTTFISILFCFFDFTDGAKRAAVVEMNEANINQIMEAQEQYGLFNIMRGGAGKKQGAVLPAEDSDKYAELLKDLMVPNEDWREPATFTMQPHHLEQAQPVTTTADDLVVHSFSGDAAVTTEPKKLRRSRNRHGKRRLRHSRRKLSVTN